MARLLIYDAYENKVYTYANLNENDPMPYSTLTTLRLREFRGKSASPTLWTTIAAMEAWNLTRRKYGRGIPVGYAFRRIWEGGHGTRSQHYAGVAFDVGQSLDQRQRTAIYNAARASGAWGYVEPLSQTPTWVHFDRRYGTPACSGTTAGYPTLRRGSRGRQYDYNCCHKCNTYHPLCVVFLCFHYSIPPCYHSCLAGYNTITLVIVSSQTR